MPKTEQVPLSLYVHLPWCIKKCPYCDFNSHTLRGDLQEQNYIDALIDDLDWQLGKYPESRPLVSLFFGGGTPNLFHAESFERLIKHIKHKLVFDDEIEITIEANPGAAQHGSFSGYRAAGINRVSIGAQSFDAEQLQNLGRIHQPADIVNAVQAAQASGFDNINLDIMFALPNQNQQQLQDDIEQALSLSPQHLSCYQLTLEPNTLFHRFPPHIPDESTALGMQDFIVERLSSQRFNRYEVSAYSLFGNECKHNYNYWQFGDYIGIGAGAHGKRTLDNKIIRTLKNKHPERYMHGVLTDKTGGDIETREVNTDDVVFEFALNALRLKGGIKRSIFEQRTGLPWQYFLDRLSAPLEQELVNQTDSHLYCTDKGYLFIDSILQYLLPDSHDHKSENTRVAFDANQ